MIALSGCVQTVATPATNAAAVRMLAKPGIDLLEPSEAGCCGAAAYHLGAVDDGLDSMRRLVDTWWLEIEAGAEAILVNASGCGSIVKEYGELLAHDTDYAHKARRIAELKHDPVEILLDEDLGPLGKPGTGRKVAFHSPCSLQHGHQLKNVAEPILARLGFALTPVPSTHLCCGSAGTDSLTQPAFSKRLRDDKLAALGFRGARHHRHDQRGLSAPPRRRRRHARRALARTARSVLNRRLSGEHGVCAGTPPLISIRSKAP